MLSNIKNSTLYYHFYLIKHDCRYFYSLFFNIKHFPWHIAKRMPIIFYEGAYAEIEGKGKIILENLFFEDHHNHIVVGQETKDFDYQCEKTYLHIEGQLRINGGIILRRGAMVDVCGNMTFGDDVVVGPRVRIRAHNSISIGNHARIAHETQIFDTNFHFSENITCPQFNPISSPISIGNYCWIGNRSTISKGTILPDYTTVASNSLVTKNFSDLPPYSLVGGTPAKLLKSDFSRVWDTKRELEYQKHEFEWIRLRFKE